MLKAGRVRWAADLEENLRWKREHPSQRPAYMRPESYGAQFRGKGYCGWCGLKGHTKRYCKLPHELRGRFMYPERCLNCKRRGHIADYCPLPVLCRNCGEPGHEGRQCPRGELSCPICNTWGHWGRDCPHRDMGSPRGDKRGSDGEDGGRAKAGRARPRPAGSDQGGAGHTERHTEPTSTAPQTGGRNREMSQGVTLASVAEEIESETPPRHQGVPQGAPLPSPAEHAASPPGGAPPALGEWEEFRTTQNWGARPRVEGPVAPMVEVRVPSGPDDPSRYVAWFVREVRAGAPEGGLTIPIECWLSLLDQERSSEEGKAHGMEALRTALSLAGVSEEWYDPLVRVLDYDSDLLGWEDRAEGLPTDHLIHSGYDWDEEEYLDARRRWRWIRAALWDFGSLSLGGPHGYPVWVSLSTHRDGGYYKHKGRSAPAPADERGPDLIYTREGSGEKVVNEAAVRLMYARNRGKAEGYTRQLGWLEENRRKWALSIEDTAWLWAVWEDIFREGLRVLGRPVDARARAQTVGIEEPSKRYSREVRGRWEVAVDCVGLGGSRGGFGEVLFTESSGAGERTWLSIREVRERWALEVAVLEAQSQHPPGAGRPGLEVLFRGREGWGLRASCGVPAQAGAPLATASTDSGDCAATSDPRECPRGGPGEDVEMEGTGEVPLGPAVGDAATSVPGEALHALPGQAGVNGPEVLDDAEMADVGPGEQERANELERAAGQVEVAGQVEGAGPEQTAEQDFGSGQGEAQGQDDVGGEWTEVKRKGRKVREGGEAQSQ